jgi:hypothetical protein
MSEEGKQEGIESTESTEPTVTNADVRNSSLFQNVTSKLATLQQQIQEKEAAEKEAKERAELQSLEAKGEYETLITRKNEEIENIRQQHVRELTERDLKLALSTAGLTNAIALNGAVAGFKGTAEDINQYVTDLQKDHADLFVGTQQQPKPTALPTGQPSSRANTNERIRSD